ncbi:MAG: molybdopterin-dependent oxidoreductase [Thermodesulfobacteriota bacterium]
MKAAQLVESVCMGCFMVCGLHAWVKDGELVGVEGLQDHPLSRGLLCPRGMALREYVYAPDRLKFPLMRRGGDWARISWDAALDLIAEKLAQLKKEYGARSLAVSVGSIGAENIEISAFAQRFRGAHGTPNFFSIEAHCFRSRIMARLLTFGTYPLEDPERSECIVLWGHNPDASEPPLAARIHEGLEKGLKLIVIDPTRIPLAGRGLHVPLRPGTDCALALGLMHVLISEGLYDRTFVQKYTTGLEILADHVKAYPPGRVAELCGIPSGRVEEIARIYGSAKSASIIQGINSLDQHVNGFQTNRSLAILQALTGNYDIPGAWCTNPFMKLADLRLPVEEDPIGAEAYPMFRRFWGMTSPYGQQMLLADALLSGKPYPVKAMIVSGGNPVAAWPDSPKTKKAFGKLEMLVVMDLFMTETARLAHIVLPACSFMEKPGLAYNYGLTAGIPYVRLANRVIEPLGESWPDWKFYTELGRRMGYGEYFPWASDEDVVEHFLGPSGITLKQLKEDHPEGVWFGRRCYDVDRPGQIRTPSGKIELYSPTLAEAGYDPLPVYRAPSQSRTRAPGLTGEYPLILTTGVRVIEYTHWQMRSIASLREKAPEPVAEVHRRTASRCGFHDGDQVRLQTRKGSILVKLRTTEDIRPDVVNLHHGWEGESNANLLTELEPRDPVTGYPQMKALACRIGRAGKNG